MHKVHFLLFWFVGTVYELCTNYYSIWQMLLFTWEEFILQIIFWYCTQTSTLQFCQNLSRDFYVIVRCIIRHHYNLFQNLYLSFRASQSIIYNKPTRCNSGNIVFINNYKYALHVSDVLCVHHQEHYKL